MSKQYFLRFLIRHQVEDLVFEVPEEAFDRLGKVLSDAPNATDQVRFFWFDTVNGKSVIINLADVQAVRFLWEPFALLPEADDDDDDDDDEYVIQISLRGAKVLKEFTEDPDQLYDLYKSLEYGPDVVAYPSFDDVDGESFHLNSREVVWIIAPTSLIKEGLKLLQEKMV